MTRLILRADEVGAIHAGRRRQFTRLVEPQPCGKIEYLDLRATSPWLGTDGGFFESGHTDDAERLDRVKCPYVPGARFWVPEAFRLNIRGNESEPGFAWQIGYRADGDSLNRAPLFDLPRAVWGDCDRMVLGCQGYLWRSALIMPRWAARLTIEVVNVRVERLQDITEAAAIDSGVSFVRGTVYSGSGEPLRAECMAARVAYRALWESIHGPGSWAANPWVRRVGFRVVGKNEAENPS